VTKRAFLEGLLVQLRITDFLQFPLKKLSRIAAASAMLVIPVTLPIRLQRQPPQLPNF
jgi:hypothetical protein